MTTAKLVKRGGRDRGDHNFYSWLVTNWPSLIAIEAQQRKLGFDPYGYDGPFNIQLVSRGPKYFVTWESYGSAD